MHPLILFDGSKKEELKKLKLSVASNPPIPHKKRERKKVEFEKTQIKKDEEFARKVAENDNAFDINILEEKEERWFELSSKME